MSFATLPLPARLACTRLAKIKPEMVDGVCEFDGTFELARSLSSISVLSCSTLAMTPTYFQILPSLCSCFPFINYSQPLSPPFSLLISDAAEEVCRPRRSGFYPTRRKGSSSAGKFHSKGRLEPIRDRGSKTVFSALMLASSLCLDIVEL